MCVRLFVYVLVMVQTDKTFYTPRQTDMFSNAYVCICG